MATLFILRRQLLNPGQPGCCGEGGPGRKQVVWQGKGRGLMVQVLVLQVLCRVNGHCEALGVLC